SAAACDSANGNEPDAPIESGNPADTVPTDTIPQITPPEQKPQGLDSVLIPEGLELVDYTPYTGPVGPLSENFRPIYVDGRRWSRVMVWEKQTRDNRYYTEEVTGNVDLDVAIAKKLRHRPDFYPDLYDTWDYLVEDGGIVYEGCPGELYYFNGELKRHWSLKTLYDVFPSESNELTSRLCAVQAKIISRGIMTLRGRQLRAAKVKIDKLMYNRIQYDYWVEGIGSLFGFIIDNNPIYTMFTGGRFDLLVQCVDKNGQLIYDYRDFDPDLYEELEILSE
ncbi:MAG: hypothetical protein K2I26_02080, partial [Paramuribaculum sp.]|nr:hypothetical protein [Paramuribaculum sp.]